MRQCASNPPGTVPQDNDLLSLYFLDQALQRQRQSLVEERGALVSDRSAQCVDRLVEKVSQRGIALVAE
ncbi:MAG TPA: hypothetical protein ENN19_12905 [Chloroflexi bacterium]|nr:hypothetical protein [Chloroflexota bacterium]